MRLIPVDDASKKFILAHDGRPKLPDAARGMLAGMAAGASAQQPTVTVVVEVR